jgi:PTS system galactitol-specific IIA component
MDSNITGVSILNKSLIKTNLEEESYMDVIQTLGNLMYKQGNVKDTYINAVIEREKSLPTGLPGKAINIAIPHTDSKHVNKSCLAVATLKNTVKFSMMGNLDKKLDTSVVFLLAIKDPNNQVMLLKNLMDVIQNGQVLNELKNAESEEKILKLLNTCRIF